MVNLQFWHVCAANLIAGIIQLCIMISLAAMKSWLKAVVKFDSKSVTFYYGAFDLADTSGSYYFYIRANTGTNTLAAMLVLTILTLIAGIAIQAVSWSRRVIFSHGPMFYMKLTQILYAVSEFFLLIGLSVYTNFWETHIIFGLDKNGNVLETTISFSTAFILAWVVWVLFLAFMVADIFFVNCVLKITTTSKDRPYQSEA